MPEDMTPGVSVEGTSFRSASIEGVATSTLGMVGATEYGPVPHPSNGAKGRGGPVLVTSMSEYERAYGGLTVREMPCRLALAGRAFFANGGQRLYVQRVFAPTLAHEGFGPDGDLARVDLPAGADTPVVRWQARWPGAAGSRVRVVARFRRGDNVQVGMQLRGVAPGAAVETAALVADQPPVLPDGQSPANLQVVTLVDGLLRLRDGAGEVTPPAPEQAAFGQGGDPDASSLATGLAALSDVDDIAIVAMPDSTYFQDEESATEAVNALISHCERHRYRFAVIDPPEHTAISEVRAFRSRFDSAFAALYYPWLRIGDPTREPDPGSPAPALEVPPSGAVAGIFARSDTKRGVAKAPASQVVHGIRELVAEVTAVEQEVLNVEAVNALRFFEGRGNLVWGARTISSNPEWKYVNLRRLLIFLEHSIDTSTRWAVFERNDERLWETIRVTVGDFLTTTWRSGALVGATPEEAFFVRCDRTTMTQNDLDNGRLVCLVGVAPTHPAEFVMFRISQSAADSTGA